MSSHSNKIYSFYARAALTETALDRVGRISNSSHKLIEHGELGKLVAIDALDTELIEKAQSMSCLLYTSPSPRDGLLSRMPSSA